MTETLAPIVEKEEAPRKKAKAKKPGSQSSFRSHWKTNLFVFLMLLYPVIHFCIMWFGVNINSIFLTFKSIYRGQLVWVFENPGINGDFFSTLFYNYKNLFETFGQSDTQQMLISSLVYFVLACFVTLPIAMVFSYFVFKKVRGASFYKIIFFIPSILPLFILCLVYKLSFDANGGILPGFFKSVGVDTGSFFNNLFIGQNVGDSPSWMVWVFCIWSGIGYDVILLTAAMSRIPRDILESVKMDGVSGVKEFFQIIIPLIWPTITTLFVFGMMAIFNTTFQPFFLTSGMYGTMTIGLRIYQQSGGSALNVPATMGLFCSVVVAPIIVAVRHGMNRCFRNVGF